MYKQRYNEQKGNAERRNIDFNLTFEEWRDIWDSSGHWEERGRGIGKFVMARYGDIGPYAVGNVKIILHTDNVIEAFKDKPGHSCTESTKELLRAANSGKKQSAETLLKRSLKLKGRPSSKKGIPLTDEHKQKCSISAKLVWEKKKNAS